MDAYRAYILGRKRKFMARGMSRRAVRALLHYRPIVEEYLEAKRDVFAERRAIWERVNAMQPSGYTAGEEWIMKLAADHSSAVQEKP